MPLFNWKCNNCNVYITRIFSVKEAANGQICLQCNVEMIRIYKGINAQTYETLDNGLMSKKVERLSDAHRLNDEHIKVDPFKDK